MKPSCSSQDTLKERDARNLNQGFLPAYYFDGCVNVGDLLTHYLLKQLYPQLTREHPPVQVHTHQLPHLMGVGSILRRATAESWVWGSGIIGEGFWPSQLDSHKLLALRGPVTKQRLIAQLNLSLPQNLPLGDPALLLPEVYCPAGIQKKYRLGYIPHYVDKKHLQQLLPQDPDVCVLDIQQPPEAFILQLLECEAVASSSLHGLIIADAYQRPNRWLKLSDQVQGEDFKFVDYYATTDRPHQKPLVIDRWRDLKSLHDNPAQFTVVKNYLGDLKQLSSALQPALQQLV